MELEGATVMVCYPICNPPAFSVLVLSHILLFKLFTLCLIFMDFFLIRRERNQFSIMFVEQLV